jgi:hypothetical protein
MMSLGDEIDEGDCRADSKSGVTWFETTVLAVAAVSGPVESTQFCKILGQRGQIAQDQSDSLGLVLLMAGRTQVRFDGE